MVTVAEIFLLIREEAVESRILQGDLPVSPGHPLDANEKSVCFVSQVLKDHGSRESPFGARRVGLVITDTSSVGMFPEAINWIAVDNPRYVFAKICDSYFPYRNGKKAQISSDLEQVQSDQSGLYIKSNTVFEHGFIGSGVTVFPGVTIMSGTFIRTGSVLGADGFGFERKSRETDPVRLHHYGGLIVGENCEIGSNVSIDRGTFHDTVVGNDVKIDNNVHVAHNVTIGRSTMIAAGSVISGSATVGSFVWIGPNATVKNRTQIGDFGHVGLGSVVLKDIGPGQRVFGNPARPI